MDWKDINKEKPIDYKVCHKYETCDVLIVERGVVKFDEFHCGSSPTPWWNFKNTHKNMVTHFIKIENIATPYDDYIIETAKEPFELTEDL